MMVAAHHPCPAAAAALVVCERNASTIAALRPSSLLSPAPRPRSSLRCVHQVRLWGASHAASLPRDEATSVVASAFPTELSPLPSIAAAGILSFGAVRAFIYFRLQYIIAAMLGRHVPRGGSRVLDLSIREGRNLYYYPKDVVEVVAIADKQNFQVVKNQAIRAGVPVDIKLKTLSALGLPSNSMDAVVSVYFLCDVVDEELKGVVREAVRLLKPGKPFIFIENVEAEWQLLRISQVLLQKLLRAFGYQGNSTHDIRRLLEEVEGLEELEYEFVLGFQDPHIVGLARKQSKVVENVTKRKRKIKYMSS